MATSLDVETRHALTQMGVQVEGRATPGRRHTTGIADHRAERQRSFDHGAAARRLRTGHQYATARIADFDPRGLGKAKRQRSPSSSGSSLRDRLRISGCPAAIAARRSHGLGRSGCDGRRPGITRRSGRGRTWSSNGRQTRAGCCKSTTACSGRRCGRNGGSARRSGSGCRRGGCARKDRDPTARCTRRALARGPA